MICNDVFKFVGVKVFQNENELLDVVCDMGNCADDKIIEFVNKENDYYKNNYILNST
ncbi:hypothetical protein [Dysgonomonas sp. 216]|uniref:hypothetical protein n=1 Tax=Dysgonomonas sp. 216 TaxID=2302934 RepID=UPI001C88332A|nr:hypothetical protein [Dysgonomonas sp. 216]